MQLHANTRIYIWLVQIDALLIFRIVVDVQQCQSWSSSGEKRNQYGGVGALHVVGGLAKTTNKLLKLLENDEIDV